MNHWPSLGTVSDAQARLGGHVCSRRDDFNAKGCIFPVRGFSSSAVNDSVPSCRLHEAGHERWVADTRDDPRRREGRCGVVDVGVDDDDVETSMMMTTTMMVMTIR